MSTGIRSRIAPTPSGYLHRGNAFNFLLTEALTRRQGGHLRLRIDDLDAPRIRPEYVLDVFDALHWLDIEPDEGPADEAELLAKYSQRHRLAHYDSILQGLAASGRVFACTCSRAALVQHSEDGQYPGTCRERCLPLDTPDAAWRFRTDIHDLIRWEDGILAQQVVSVHSHARDFIVRRRDGLAAYHVASLCDDVDYDINLVVRGEDLLYSTAAQRLLADVLGLEGFLHCRFYHHPLLKNEAAEKLSKSTGSYSLKAAREAGIGAAEIRRMAEGWYGQFMPAPWQVHS